MKVTTKTGSAKMLPDADSHGIFREGDTKQNMPIARGVLKRTDSKPYNL
jgi:hypothetical protein